MIRNNSLVVRHARPLGVNLDFIARYLNKPRKVASLLARQNPMEVIKTINNPTFPIRQGIEILHSFYEDAEPPLACFFLKKQGGH